MSRKQVKEPEKSWIDEWLKPNERINAIAWAAREKNMSYGNYQAQLTEQERDKVYKEYGELLRQREKEEADRIAAHINRKAAAWGIEMLENTKNGMADTVECGQKRDKPWTKIWRNSVSEQAVASRVGSREKTGS